jgi:hypothetical protein
LGQNVEQHWQYLDPLRRARNSEDLLEIINVLGDATTEELRERCDEKLEEYLSQLQQQERIVLFDFQNDGETQTRWVSVAQKAL